MYYFLRYCIYQERAKKKSKLKIPDVRYLWNCLIIQQHALFLFHVRTVVFASILIYIILMYIIYLYINIKYL